MKTIFVYGILQKNYSAGSFGLTDGMYKGRATLKGFKRDGLCKIDKSVEKTEVTGDIFEVPNTKEEELYDFEAGFGYRRGFVKPVRMEDNKEFEAIAYLL